MSTIPQVSNKCLSSFKWSGISLCLNRFNAELVFILTKSKSSHDPRVTECKTSLVLFESLKPFEKYYK